MIILVRDLYDKSDVIAILQTKTTTADQVKEIIEEVKSEYEEDYTFDDVLERLPEDVELIEDRDSVYF